MRFEVPQFIEIEDKIFGPFTWKQSIYLAGGVGTAASFFLLGWTLLFIVIGLPIVGLALALSFFQVNSRPFSILLESFYNYLINTKLYLWRRSKGVVYRNDSLPDPTLERSPEKRAVGVTRDLASLAREVELQAIDKPE